MTRTEQNQAARKELARRIQGARAVSVSDDPARSYRRNANLCRQGALSYNRMFGIGKAQKADKRDIDSPTTAQLIAAIAKATGGAA